MENKKIGVLGGGSWATALIKLISNSYKVTNWYIRDEDNIEHIKKHKHNKHYLSSIVLNPEKLNLSSNVNNCIENSDIIIIAIPAAFIKDTLSNLKLELSTKYVISAVKGIIPEDNMIIADFLHQSFNLPIQNIGVIAGPCHAEEIAMERLSFLTIASTNTDLAKYISGMLKSHFTKISISDDIYGTEYSAVLKNIFAIASGICNGLGFGDNFQAALVSNAIREIKRFVDKVHPISRDIKSSTYLGDLLVTAYSKFSRNLLFGNMIGKGYSVKAAQIEMKMIAEGYYAVKGIHEINKKFNIDMPITEAVYNILYSDKAPYSEINILINKLS